MIFDDLRLYQLEEKAKKLYYSFSDMNKNSYYMDVNYSDKGYFTTTVYKGELKPENEHTERIAGSTMLEVLDKILRMKKDEVESYFNQKIDFESIYAKRNKELAATIFGWKGSLNEKKGGIIETIAIRGKIVHWKNDIERPFQLNAIAFWEGKKVYIGFHLNQDFEIKIINWDTNVIASKEKEFKQFVERKKGVILQYIEENKVRWMLKGNLK